MRRLGQLGMIVLFAGILFGCGSARPVKYYELNIPVASPPGVHSFPVAILVGRVTAPYIYRDNRIVYSLSDVQLGTYEYQRWAGPPADMIQNLLVSSLRGTGQYRSIGRLGSHARGEYILRGHLSALNEMDKPEFAARFALQLELFDVKSGTVVWTDSYSHDEPVHEKTVAAVVEAMSRNVHAGIDHLTASLGQYFATHPPPAH